MILYRTQGSSGDGWATEWSGTQSQARVLAKQLEAAGYHSLHVDRMTVATDRESMIAALNHAAVHRINWDGDEVTR